MKLTVGGRNRADVGAEVSAVAQALKGHVDAPAELESFHGALILRDSDDASDYIERLLGLMALRTGLNVENFYIPRRPGPFGRAMASAKKVLWKLLRYQQERLASQQSAVNEQVVIALQLMREDHLDQVRRLEERVKELEAHAPPH